MKRTWLLSVLIAGILLPASGQRYAMKKLVNPKISKELTKLVDDIFVVNPNITYNVSHNDLQFTFDEIKNTAFYDIDFLNKAAAALRTDTLNPYLWKDMAMFYLINNNREQSTYYFEKCLQLMHISYFKNDSASFYQFKALIFFHMGNQECEANFKKALTHNPTDSASIIGYSLLLLQSSRFTEARDLSIQYLKTFPRNPEIFYIALLISDIVGAYNRIFLVVSNDSEVRSHYLKKNYNELVDFSNIDYFAKMYRDNVKIQTARNMADVLALVAKMTFFETTDSKRIKYAFSSVDKSRIKELEKWLADVALNKTLNEYSLNKNIGTVLLFQDKPDKAALYLEKAVTVFPMQKINDFFNPVECYNSLLCALTFTKNNIQFRKILQTKMDADVDSVSLSEDCLLMARHHFELKMYDEANIWASKAVLLNPANTYAHMIIANLEYKKDNTLRVEQGITEASKYVSSYDQQYDISMQMAAYSLMNNDATNAMVYIKYAKDSRQGQKCESCEELIKKYVVIFPY
ncbi:MAG: hypothetical protein ACHQF2_05845 [Flavobacteriales bacterium]